MDRVRWCPGCDRHLWVAIPSSPLPSFNRKVDGPGGLQPYCRECDWRSKATLKEAWNAFVRGPMRKEPASAGLWTPDLYFQTIGDDPHCNWCGASCREWGVGHWIDRQSSDYGHIPSNCVPCCSPCNFHKGHKPYAVHEAFLRSLIRSCPEFPQGMGRHPWSKVPWDNYPSSSRKFRRAMPPDLSAYVVELQLSLGGIG